MGEYSIEGDIEAATADYTATTEASIRTMKAQIIETNSHKYLWNGKRLFKAAKRNSTGWIVVIDLERENILSLPSWVR